MMARYRISHNERGVYERVADDRAAARLRNLRGHDDVTISWHHLRATGFVLDRAGGTPIGTAFTLAAIPVSSAKEEPRIVAVYLVTCRHVVMNCADPHVRFRTLTNKLVDYRLPRPFFHPDIPEQADVAVYRYVVPDPDEERFTFPLTMRFLFNEKTGKAHIPKWLATHGYVRARGQDVFYAGYLEPVPSMGNDRMIPMIRGAKLGAWDQEDVPFNPNGATIHMRAHLIDANAYHGFSGSPCFVKDPNNHDPKSGAAFIGMLAGFFKWEVGEESFPVNAGVGIVVPSDRIAETLSQEALVKDREEIRKRVQEDYPRVRPSPGEPASSKPGPEPECLRSDETMENGEARHGRGEAR
jgi:hypothetical protein